MATEELQGEDLMKHAQEQREACAKELKELLDKYNCRLEPQVLIRGDKVIPQIFIEYGQNTGV